MYCTHESTASCPLSEVTHALAVLLLRCSRPCNQTSRRKKCVDVLHFCYVFPTWSVVHSFDSSGRNIDTSKTACLPELITSYPLARLYNMPNDATLLSILSSPHLHQWLCHRICTEERYKSLDIGHRVFSYAVMQFQICRLVWLEWNLSIMPCPQLLVDEGIDGYVSL